MRIKDARDLFPIVERYLYFDAASLSPYCTPVIDAIENFMNERRDSASLNFDEWRNRIESSRGMVASMINSEAEEIAFTKNTSEGVNLTTMLVEWEKGDEVLVWDCDFPTNIYPFLNLKRKGVKTRYIQCRKGKVELEEIDSVLNEKTRLLSISHVFYDSGYRVDLGELGKICRDHDILFHVDAAQSLGAFRIDVKRCNIDFLSAPGFKWLLSPLGTGVFYVNKGHVKGSPVVGWLSVKEPKKFDTRDYELLEGAKRFEAGTLDIGGFIGMAAALKLISSIGVKAIERRVLQLSKILSEELRSSGLGLLSDWDEKNRSGIVSINKGELTKKALIDSSIVATLRDNLRLSPHIYNNEEEIEKIVEFLSKHRG